jgi:hypothetical protein
MEHERDMPDAQAYAPTLQDRLRGKPLYAQCGEESNLPDDAADALDAAQAEIAKLSKRVEAADAMADSFEWFLENENGYHDNPSEISLAGYRATATT